MALIKCKNCGNFISDKAKACPKCGAPNIPSPTETNEDAKFQSEEKENTDHAINPEANSPHQEDHYYNPDQAPKPSHKKLYILLAILIIVIAGDYFYAQHQNKLEEARWEAKRIEQLHQDSIEAARIEAERLEAARLDSIRKDSIAKEEKRSNAAKLNELNSLVGKKYIGYGNGGGLSISMEIKFQENNKCICISDWYCSYPDPVIKTGSYKLKGNKVIVNCNGCQLIFNKKGDELYFNNDQEGGGSIGNDNMYLRLSHN